MNGNFKFIFGRERLPNEGKAEPMLWLSREPHEPADASEGIKPQRTLEATAFGMGS